MPEEVEIVDVTAFKHPLEDIKGFQQGEPKQKLIDRSPLRPNKKHSDIEGFMIQKHSLHQRDDYSTNDAVMSIPKKSTHQTTFNDISKAQLDSRL